MLAVIKTGGKQYKVSEKDLLQVELLGESKAGDMLTLHEVLMVADSDNVSVGTPYVEGAAVEVKILDHVKGDKIKAFTYQAKKRHQKTWGHRQKYTEVEVVRIMKEGAEKKAKAEKKIVKEAVSESEMEKTQTEVKKVKEVKKTVKTDKAPAAKKAPAKKVAKKKEE